MLSGHGDHHHHLSFQSNFPSSSPNNTLYHSAAAPSTLNSTIYTTPARHRYGVSHSRSRSDAFPSLSQTDRNLSIPHPPCHQEQSYLSHASHEDLSRAGNQSYEEAINFTTTLQHQLNEAR
jgi:hypothetical protein